MKHKLLHLIVCMPFLIIDFSFKEHDVIDDEKFVFYKVNPKTDNVRFYLKDDMNVNFGSIQNLKIWLQKRNQKLVFAMNAGMYKENRMPLGLYVENGKVLVPINKHRGSGNFYLQPNGIVYITFDNSVFISKSENFPFNSKNIKFASQSGPLLVVDGKINSIFQKNSQNVNIRNGVGVLPGNTLIFAMSKTEVCFYEFASFFQKLGCKNALYLDGFVSRTYLPEQNWIQTDGNFGAMIGVTNPE